VARLIQSGVPAVVTARVIHDPSLRNYEHRGLPDFISQSVSRGCSVGLLLRTLSAIWPRDRLLAYFRAFLRRGIAKSRNARSFSGSRPWLVWMTLIGVGAGSNLVKFSTLISAPVWIALLT
jgi:hypothetical protein